jgi:hypothetical protein
LYDDERSRKKVELPFLYIDNSTTRREAQLHIDWTLKLVFLLGENLGMAKSRSPIAPSQKQRNMEFYEITLASLSQTCPPLLFVPVRS